MELIIILGAMVIGCVAVAFFGGRLFRKDAAKRAKYLKSIGTK